MSFYFTTLKMIKCKEDDHYDIGYSNLVIWFDDDTN